MVIALAEARFAVRHCSLTRRSAKRALWRGSQLLETRLRIALKHLAMLGLGRKSRQMIKRDDRMRILIEFGMIKAI